MSGEVLRRVVAARKKSLIAWTISLIALMALMVLAYPAVADQDVFAEMMEDYPEFVEQIMGLGSGLSITSPAGYLNSQVFANMLPLLIIIFVIGLATKETAGEERDGTLDLLLAHPVTRSRVVIEKSTAMLATGLWLGVVSAVTLIAFGPLVDLDVGIGAYVGATLSSVAAGWVFGALALALGAATGSRAVAIGGASGAAVVFYVLWGLAPLIGALEFTNTFNPWYWVMAGDPILHGIQGANLLLLAGITGALVATAVWGLRRRDLGV
jgi:ABC-2 type transport system permease protein